MPSSDYYIFAKKRSFFRKHVKSAMLGSVVLVAFAVHVFVLDLAAQDRDSYGRQYVRFAFAQPGFRSYLAGRAARARHIAISRVLTRANHPEVATTAPSVGPLTYGRAAKDIVDKPSGRSTHVGLVATEAVLRDGGIRRGHRQPSDSGLEVALEGSHGVPSPASRLTGAPVKAGVAPATKVRGELSRSDMQPSEERQAQRIVRARRLRAKTKPVVIKQKPTQGLPVWAYKALFQPEG